MDKPDAVSNPEQVDYKLIFDMMPGMCLVLDAKWRILAQNADHAKKTLSASRNVIGMYLFEAFPDNPNDSGADGVATVRQSLLNVLKTRQRDVMPVVRYDVRPALGGFETRYWVISNTPILSDDGFVRWIINRAEDVTDIVRSGSSPV